MIPLRDKIRPRSFPIVNLLLIVLNVLLYVWQTTLGEETASFISQYALIPARYTHPEGLSIPGTEHPFLSFLTFMFLHGSFWHLLGNMWFLYIFGDNVEDRLGSWMYLVFYMLCGLVSGFSHILLNPESTMPAIGASGAVAGIMGAYFLLYPTSRILTLVPVFFIPWIIEIPAILFLGLWFLLQFLSAYLTGGQIAGIAWWAHIGGFLFGALFVKITTPKA